eukprot:gnl/TRDRNA2_/TRDRNA2_167760_c0_seq5.p1 gnl/TRDRNA2_/TRDRNA2_167760_c0~~gnl/TRDRNA2_/TRDRNA2_167760_c0_seq5.p1  ORF type:complete len:196 (+),score=6.44 gnl/TRDRNA2_/TRDRNA2_167760_c0_seq5:61-648(+)
MPPALLVFEVIRLHLLEAALMRSVGFGDTGSAPPDRMLQGHSSSIALLACLPTPFVKVTCRYHGTVFTHVNGCAQLPVRSGLRSCNTSRRRTWQACFLLSCEVSHRSHSRPSHVEERLEPGFAAIILRTATARPLQEAGRRPLERHGLSTRISHRDPSPWWCTVHRYERHMFQAIHRAVRIFLRFLALNGSDLAL